MSQTYASGLIVLLVQLLPLIGVNVGSAELTTTIQTIVTVAGAVWVLVRRFQVGDIAISGARK